MARRRPVPRGWREEHHDLTVVTRIAGGGWGGWGRVYRSRGYCSCGKEWPTGQHANNLNAEDVRDFWNDHVEHEYYNERV